MRSYYVYILTNRSGTLYVGITNNLRRRIQEHRDKAILGFTRHYNLDRLIYFETTEDVQSAIAREKQIKRWRRQKKVALIRTINPEWRDLFLDSE